MQMCLWVHMSMETKNCGCVLGKDAVLVNINLQNCTASDQKFLILIFAAPRTSNLGITS